MPLTAVQIDNWFPVLTSSAQLDGFLVLVEPLVARARVQLQAGIDQLLAEFPEAPFRGDDAEAMFVANLLAQFPMMIDRTLVLELNVARLSGNLSGATSEERFQSFVDNLRDRDTALAILQEYPVLARQLKIGVEHWLESSIEFLRRLCEDFAAIRAKLSPAHDPGMLVEISGGAGDRHARGRAVLIAKFDSSFRLVYKPKSVAVVEHFQELLGWLNEHGADPAFRRIGVIERGTHGWIEFVAHAACTQPEEVERFYRRQGAFLALFYALEATDFHAENVIASGEHPVPIDLEALFHPRIETADAAGAAQRTVEVLNHSVIRVGLLPELIDGTDDAAGVDISGFGDLAGQMSPHAIPDWDQFGTDEMRLVRRRMPMEGSQNRPRLNGVDIDVLDYVETIADGFASMYRLLMACREELLAQKGPLSWFVDDEVRAVLRPTRFYADLLHESFHPDLLRDALDRDRHFDRLSAWLKHEPCLAQVIGAELEDLNQGDIPIFATRPESCDIWDSLGRRVPRFFRESGMDLTRRRLRSMDEADLARQQWIIDATFATLAGEHGFVDLVPQHVARSAADVRERLLAAAKTVGDRLDAIAIRSGDEATWLGLLNFKKNWSIGSLGLDLYGGLPGVALFLAYLGDATSEPRYTDLACRAVAAIRRQLFKANVRWIGGFDGLGGLIYTYTHLSALWHDAALASAAEQLINSLPQLINDDQQLDIIGGSAGCVGALLAHHDRTRSPAALAMAVRCGERLLANATSVDSGLGWIVPGVSSKPLAGFSHGAAGIAWALLKLAGQTADNRFRRAALAAISYERSLFSPDTANWLGNQDGHEVAWCHGAPGIALGRLSTLPLLDDALVRAEIDIALRTTLEHGWGRTPTLCHGDLGNLDILLEASAVLGEPRLKSLANCRVRDVLDSVEANGWLCATPLGVESPGLMTGLAGIGFGLLRLAEPEAVPSVLNLSPPVMS